MINTIFYFVDQESTYKNMLQNNEISSRTIVFAADRGSIYKNGIRYGGVRSDELQQLLDDTNWHDTVESHLQNIDNLIEGLNSNINSLVIYNEEQIGDMINSAFEEYDWLKKKFSDVDWGEIFKWSEWNDKMSQYLAGIGVITESGAKWTELKADVNSIKTSITNIDGNEVLNSHLEQYIEDKIAGLNLSATYAKIEDLNNLSGDLEDLSAEIANKASLDLLAGYVTKASLTAYAKTSDVDTKIGTVETKIDNLTDTVTTSLSSTVRDYIEDELGTDIQKYLSNTSGVITEATLDQAVAALFSNSSSETSGELSSFTSSFATQSDLQNATASMVVTSDLNDYVKKAGIIAAINNDQSAIKISADKIEMDASDIELTANRIIYYNSGDIYTTLDTDGFILRKYVDRINDMYNSVGITEEGFFTQDAHGTIGCKFNIDGSGEIAQGALSWDKDGNINVQSLLNIIQQAQKTWGHGLWDMYEGRRKNPCYVVGNMAETTYVEGQEITGPYARIILDGGDASQSNSMGSIEIESGYILLDAEEDKIYIRSKDGVEIEGGDVTLGSSSEERNLIVHGTVGAYGELSVQGDAHLLDDLYVLGDVEAGNYITKSDERVKDIQNTIDPAIEDIANTRIVNYKLKSNNDKIYTGAIAQDWQNILPNTVTTDKDGHLGLNYQSAALVSAVTAAREIVNLKRENELLKQRLDSIEERLGIN